MNVSRHPSKARFEPSLFSPGGIPATAGAVLLPWILGQTMPGLLASGGFYAWGAAALLGCIMLIGLVPARIIGGARRGGQGGRRGPSPASPPCRRPAAFPGVTIGVIAIGTATFVFFPEGGCRMPPGLPLEALDFPTLVHVTVAGVFNHADAGDLIVNLALLAFLGSFLERRFGPGRILATVCLAGVLASAINLNLLLPEATFGGAAAPSLPYVPIGTSGAVAGLMGFGALQRGAHPGAAVNREHAPQRRFEPAALAGPMLIGLFLLRDFSDAGAATAATVDYWAHLGALAAGLVVATVAAVEDLDAGTRGFSPPPPETSRLDAVEGCGIVRHMWRARDVRVPACTFVQNRGSVPGAAPAGAARLPSG